MKSQPKKKVRREVAGKEVSPSRQRETSPQKKIRRIKPPESFGAQLERVSGALEQALARRDLSVFYRAFRASELPFLPCEPGVDPGQLVRSCHEILHKLGSLSPAVALAVENHYYVTSAIATLPAGGNAGLEERRRRLLDLIRKRRYLVANTNSRVQAEKLGSLGTQARREGEGFRVSGSAAYMSLASEGDLVVFITRLDGEGIAFFVAPLKGAPDIEIGPYLFPNAMVDSDTRRVTFQEATLGPESLLIAGRNREVGPVVLFQIAWHQSLIPSLFLGGAARALEEVRGFLRTVRTPEDVPLASLDGMVVDVGRLAIEYRAACCVVHRAQEALGAMAKGELSAEVLEATFNLANAAKYVGTRCAEEIVGAARRIIGARSFAANHPLERLSQEIVFGPLGGEVHAGIERRYGQVVLGERSFLENHW